MARRIYFTRPRSSRFSSSGSRGTCRPSYPTSCGRSRQVRVGDLDACRPRHYPRLVVCDECGRTAEADCPAAGWVAFRVDLADDPDPPEVVVYCPECAAHEFGER